MTYQSKFSKKFLALTLSAAIVGGAVVPAITSAAGFKDVENGKWYTEAINALSSKSIINGIDGNLFKPADKMTKAEAVKMIAVAKGLKIEDVKAPGFSDVKEGQWFYKYVAAAKEAGIVKGDGTGKFDPNKKIDRAEMASLLVSAYNLDAKDAKINFTDVQASDWFYDEVQALVASGLTNGTSEKTFSPKKSLNRAEGAQFIYRAVNKEAADKVAAEKTAQFIYDVNIIKGEGNLAEKFAKLKYEAFDKLTEAQQTEVAKLFLLKKGDTTFKTVDEITTAVDTAIKSYNELVGAVNKAANATEMKTSLQAIGTLFNIEVTDEMANTVLKAKPENGFTTVKEMITLLQPAADASTNTDTNTAAE